MNQPLAALRPRQTSERPRTTGSGWKTRRSRRQAWPSSSTGTRTSTSSSAAGPASPDLDDAIRGRFYGYSAEAIAQLTARQDSRAACC